MIRVALPAHLKALAKVSGEVSLDAGAPATIGSALDALEKRYPALCGTIRDHVTLKRRPLVRFFACQTDYSFEPPDTLLPEAVLAGKEPFIILGSIAGG